MDAVFLQVLNMSFTGGVVILAVLIGRLLLRKAPRIFSYTLWSIVLFRLICPVTISLPISLLPVNSKPVSPEILTQASPAVNTGIPFLDQTVNTFLPTPAAGDSMNPLQVWAAVGSWLWLIGAAALLACSLICLFRLRRKLKGAVSDGSGVMVSQKVDTPFVIGFFRPVVYLPAGLSAEEKEYILLHERTHIRRKDHFIRLASFLVLCVHWFNPLVWLAFFLSGKDMEMSCDEAVIRKLGNEVKKPYSASLLALSCGRKLPGGTPLAFGEGEVKGRIKNILSFKKPAFWVTILAVVAVAAICLGLLVDAGASGKTEIQFSGNGEPFTLTLELPEGWTVVSEEGSEPQFMPPEEKNIFLDQDGNPAGSVSFGTFEHVEGVPDDQYYQVAYSGIRLGSLVQWCGDYTPVRTTDTGETATGLLYVNNSYQDPDRYDSAAGAGFVEYPSITSYDKERCVYVAMYFELDTVTEEELIEIAESIILS